MTNSWPVIAEAFQLLEKCDPATRQRFMGALGLDEETMRAACVKLIELAIAGARETKQCK